MELAVVRVTVVGADNHPMTGLTNDDFVVLENGVAQPVLYFLSSEVPVDVALLLDSSSSVGPMLRKLRATAAAFLDRLRPGDRGLVATFSDRIEVLADLTARCRQPRETPGGVRLSWSCRMGATPRVIWGSTMCGDRPSNPGSLSTRSSTSPTTLSRRAGSSRGSASSTLSSSHTRIGRADVSRGREDRPEAGVRVDRAGALDAVRARVSGTGSPRRGSACTG